MIAHVFSITSLSLDFALIFHGMFIDLNMDFRRCFINFGILISL
jgi:hypothetical protein